MTKTKKPSHKHCYSSDFKGRPVHAVHQNVEPTWISKTSEEE